MFQMEEIQSFVEQKKTLLVPAASLQNSKFIILLEWAGNLPYCRGQSGASTMNVLFTRKWDNVYTHTHINIYARRSHYAQANV